MSGLPITVRVHQTLARRAPSALTCADLAAVMQLDVRQVKRAVLALSTDGLVRAEGRRQRFGGNSWTVVS